MRKVIIYLMLGNNETQEDLYVYKRVQDFVPEDHFLRKVNALIDFSTINKKMAPYYSKDKGRPSKPPELLYRMLIVGYLNGITSVRRLCQEVQLNLAYRWFCGLGLDDKVPDHSLFSKNNERFAGNDITKKIFNNIVQQAIDKGLVSGKHLIADATFVNTDAAMASLKPIIEVVNSVIVPVDPETYLHQFSVRKEEEKTSK